jgi:hypothetical protein
MVLHESWRGDVETVLLWGRSSASFYALKRRAAHHTLRPPHTRVR